MDIFYGMFFVLFWSNFRQKFFFLLRIGCMEVNSIYYYNIENHKVLKNGPKSENKNYTII